MTDQRGLSSLSLGEVPKSQKFKLWDKGPPKKLLMRRFWECVVKHTQLNWQWPHGSRCFCQIMQSDQQKAKQSWVFWRKIWMLKKGTSLCHLPKILDPRLNPFLEVKFSLHVSNAWKSPHAFAIETFQSCFDGDLFLLQTKKTQDFSAHFSRNCLSVVANSLGEWKKNFLAFGNTF